MREAEREEGKASNTMAHERHISVCRTEADGGRTRRTDNGNRNRSGGRLEAAGPTRREENGEAGTAADKGTAEHSNPSIEIGTMIFVIIVMFSSVGYENRQFGPSEPR